MPKNHSSRGHPFGRAVSSVSSSLQRLQVGDDILAILSIGNADDHLGSMYICRGIGEIFVELLLVPCDTGGFEGGEIVVARRGPALASEYARERWADLVLAGLR